MSHFKRSQAKYVKKPYKINNWPEYERGLVNRGSLTVWIADDAIREWHCQPNGRPGGQRRYSSLAIETALTVRMVYHLPWRQTKGFLGSIVNKLELQIEIPHHTTFSRRARKLGKVALFKARHDRPIHIIVDSTGVKVHSGNMRKPPKNRAWRKFHVTTDMKTGDIVACVLGSKRAPDASRVPALLRQIGSPILSMSADSAYDTCGVYKIVESQTSGRSPRVLIPPKTNARLDLKSDHLKERNRNIRSRNRLGKRKWHTQSGYSMRSLVENTMYIRTSSVRCLEHERCRGREWKQESGAKY
jgi:hypothetical protein